jgi:hypothetical protein
MMFFSGKLDLYLPVFLAFHVHLEISILQRSLARETDRAKAVAYILPDHAHIAVDCT